MVDYLSTLYAVVICGVICFQIALILGAPWGPITQGGTNPGALPARGRVIAGFSIALLVFMAASMFSAAGVAFSLPRWTGWVVVAINCVMMILNWITPSVPERRLWGPITTVIACLGLSIMLL